MSLKLIVGLGNPGQQYMFTRHNAGFWFVHHLAQQFNIALSPDKKFHGVTGRGQIHGHDVRLLLPLTFMNKSGESVVPMVNFYDIHNDQLLIAHDELDIPAGSIKLKTGGGHGGHNGLRDITPHLGNDFHRLRVGIGHPGHKSKVTGHVLSKASPDEQIAIDSALTAAFESLPLLLAGDIERARTQINGFKLPD
ncbi:PTH1 family peptidyl-tRNA hydrolase [Psychrobacter sp. PL15]|jgi:PTH1 family peptidyl-tRNA hydrolase|uniref:aminoacyl-tRNA hydrolase n=1 Tax=unclassified Psychrobacter TaxID=196806 RepID=UPI001AE49412|nr:aminoacyl-tRNA hydrolase [Psychrobacter sp. PL15]MEC5209592.1 PTH1 family peptidyl-tRNA hydrolase [Psychrobacter sp. PL15]